MGGCQDLAELAEIASAAIETNRAATDRTQTTLTEARAQALAGSFSPRPTGRPRPVLPHLCSPVPRRRARTSSHRAERSLTIAEGRIDAAQSDLNQLHNEREQLDELEGPASQNSSNQSTSQTALPTGDTDAAVATAQEAVQEARRARRQHLQRTQGHPDPVRKTTTTPGRLYSGARRLASRSSTQAAAAALTGTAERLAGHIEPLSQQVRWRWKALFGEDGLQLRPDGTIVRVVGDRELPWSQLSSGEQIWARLVASLLVLRSSTTLPFAWLDEPLEHLDPRARRIVATDLASSTRSAGRPR